MLPACCEVRKIPGRGNGLVSTTALEAGTEFLTEPPLLLTIGRQAAHAACVTCLRQLETTAEACTSCNSYAFCSLLCRSTALRRPEIHAPWICRALGRLQLTSDEEHGAAHFLLQVCALQLAPDEESRTRLSALTRHAAALGSASNTPHSSAVYEAAAAACGGRLPISLHDAARLLALEQCTSYGIMAPSAEEGRRQIRGGALYPTASFLNHECLPNVARFDDFDGAGDYPANTVARFRMLHAVPPGEELTQSYFPLVWDLQERAAACREQYDFDCDCPRCQVEKTWEEDEADVEMGSGSEDVSADESAAAGISQDPGHETEGKDRGGITEGYINMFLMKFVCPQSECFGTMAPIGPSSQSLECNMCGHHRTEAQFLAEMNQ